MFQKLPVQVFVMAPHAGRFTRQIETDIVSMNTIGAVTDLVKNSLIFELKATNIDISKTMFAGLMTYGPTTVFDKGSITSFTRGLFLQEAAYKAWWLASDKNMRKAGDMVKIAVVLMHEDEAAKRQLELPYFWTRDKVEALGSRLEKLEMPLWDFDIDQGWPIICKDARAGAGSTN